MRRHPLVLLGVHRLPPLASLFAVFAGSLCAVVFAVRGRWTSVPGSLVIAGVWMAVFIWQRRFKATARSGARDGR